MKHFRDVFQINTLRSQLYSHACHDIIKRCVSLVHEFRLSFTYANFHHTRPTSSMCSHFFFKRLRLRRCDDKDSADWRTGVPSRVTRHTLAVTRYFRKAGFRLHKSFL